jgi:hypothetical protein
MIELILLGGNKNKDNQKRLNDSFLLAIFTLPYLYDFLVGIVCFYMLIKIAENNSAIKKGDLEDQNENKEEILGLRLHNNEHELKNEIIKRQEQSELINI